MRAKSTPTRASSRIRAMAKAAAAEDSTTQASSPPDASSNAAATASTKRTVPQAPSPAASITHGFQAPASAATPAVTTRPSPPKGVSPTTTSKRQTPNAPVTGPPPPPSSSYHPRPPPPPPPGYAAHPPPHYHGAAPPYNAPSHPPPPMIPVDPKVLEERKRNAFAYAMQDHAAGGTATRGHRRKATGPTTTSSNASGTKGATTTTTAAAASKATKAAGSKSTTAVRAPPTPATVAIKPNYPPASELISGVHALAEAAASASAAPVKRRVGRPRKNESAATTTTTTKRRVGRPRKHGIPTAAAAAAAAATPAASTRKHEFYMVSDAQMKATMTNHATTTTANAIVSQSIPSSNASSDNDDNNKHGERSSQSGTPSPSNYNPLPLRRDASSVYDDEYARFMRSIMGGDDQSITTFKTWKSVQSKGGGEQGSMVGGSVMGSAFETLDEDDVSYQLTSDEEDDDEDDDDEEEDGEENEETHMSTAHESPQKQSTSTTAMQQTLPPTPMILPHSEETNDEDLMNVFGEIEGLMEEDLEAAVMASLIGAPGGENAELLSGSAWQKPGTFGASTKAPNRASMGAIMGTQQQKAITTPGQSTKKQKSTTTVVTTPSPCVGKDHHRRGGSSANAGAAKIANAASRAGGAALEVPAVSKDQLARLRGIMARHHQLLLQQATLSVRAAYVQKVRKDGISNMSPNKGAPASSRGRGGKKADSSSLPESRLDTRSLTFCSRPVADAGCSYVNDFFGGETPEELSECLDGAVGMLQDLEQNWKDAVRNSIQLPSMVSQAQQTQTQGGRRNLNFGDSSASSQTDPNSGNNNNSNNVSNSNMRLTRSAFTKTLLERELEMSSPDKYSSVRDTTGASSPRKAQHPPSSSEPQHYQNNDRVSVFYVRGLARLKETFSALDNSVNDIKMGREKGNNKDGFNILAPDQHGKACETLLKHARAEICTEYLPGRPDLGKCLTHAPEAFDEPDKVNRPLTKKQEAELRKSRHAFTAGEDNLILRGVNLYGEKEWCLVSDRFLPDRVVNSISQRYNKLCFLIYKANGIEIDEKGKLGVIPTFPKGATYDESKVNKISPARAPTTMNVHRWTLEEDIAILKAVPIMGNLWAEICTKLMPHRDRGHIRKRYQVLQRRIPKGITKMNMKYLKRAPEQRVAKSPKSPKRARTSPASRSSPAKKKTTSKKKASSTNKLSGKLAATAPAAPAVKLLATAAASKAVTTAPLPPSRAETEPTSAASASMGIFQHLVNASKRLPMSPIKSASRTPRSIGKGIPIKSSPIRSSPIKNPNSQQSSPQIVASSPPSIQSPPKKVTRPFTKNHGSQALQAVINSEVEKNEAECQSGNGPSPETRGVAAVLGGFSTSSRLDFASCMEQEEDTQMGVEKILGNNDDWSQASGMQRLIEAGTAESHFMPEHHHGEEGGTPTKSSDLPTYHVHNGEASGLSVMNGERNQSVETQGRSSRGGERRKSILSSVMEKTNENALKRKSSAAFPSTPTKASPNRENVLPAPDGYPSSIPTSMSFNLDTPAKEEALTGLSATGAKGELSMNQEMFEYFMSSDKSRMATPGRPGTMNSSPTKTSTTMMMSPIKLGSSTPLSQFGTLLSGGISGPLTEGCNSLFMGASDFDAVAALKDLSNSAPNTPSKLLRPRDGQLPQEAVPYDQDVGAEAVEEHQMPRSKKPRTSLFGQVKAKVEERKMG